MAGDVQLNSSTAAEQNDRLHQREESNSPKKSFSRRVWDAKVEVLALSIRGTTLRGSDRSHEGKRSLWLECT